MLPELQLPEITMSKSNLDLFDSLVPQTENSAEYEEDYINTNSRVGMDVLPERTFNEIIEHCLKHRKFRDCFWFVVQANFGIRYSDVCKLKRIDFIDSNNKIRDRVVIREKKTAKPRMMYINDAVKMALLMHLWNGKFEPMDYLINSEGNRKSYEVEMVGRKIKRNADGQPVYKLDEHGNKIPKPLTRERSEQIMKKILIDELNIPLMNNLDTRLDGEEKYCTHSIRKLYGAKVSELFVKGFRMDEEYASMAALQFLRQDYNHSDTTCSTTSRYIGNFEATKQRINLQMNLGYNVLEKYFQYEKERYLNGGI